MAASLSRLYSILPSNDYSMVQMGPGVYGYMLSKAYIFHCLLDDDLSAIFLCASQQIKSIITVEGLLVTGIDRHKGKRSCCWKWKCGDAPGESLTQGLRTHGSALTSWRWPSLQSWRIRQELHESLGNRKTPCPEAWHDSGRLSECGQVHDMYLHGGGTLYRICGFPQSSPSSLPIDAWIWEH